VFANTLFFLSVFMEQDHTGRRRTQTETNRPMNHGLNPTCPRRRFLSVEARAHEDQRRRRAVHFQNLKPRP
jgi:hypothetical protein